jgi:two-component system phosphate regulon response regulator PhoB
MGNSSLILVDSLNEARTEAPINLNQPLVMVVDDHADTRDLLRYVIEANGCRVIEAADGEQAVRLAEVTLPNLILMDTTLPRVDGFRATERIRKLDGGRQVAIIFLSGQALPRSRELALAAGGDDYFVKPVSLEELERALLKYLTATRAATAC